MMLNDVNKLKVGIDSLAVYTPRYALDLATLAQARGIDVEKYHSGLGQYVMSVPAPGEDVVTMAANAAKQALKNSNRNSTQNSNNDDGNRNNNENSNDNNNDTVNVDDIEMLLFATESGIDQSKSAGIYVHGLLNLPARCRVLELKQACYGATAGIQLALSFLREHPNKKVLVVASDIARYGLNTTGESSQGAGAVAMVLSANPRVLAIESEYGVVTENVMDFWRPNYSHEAFVDGKYSSKLYLTMLEKSWEQYSALANRNFEDHAYFCYHTPVPRLVEKAHQHLLKITKQTHLSEEEKSKHIQNALEYGRQTGNSYTASLYIGLASLLDHASEDLSGKRIGFYSYGSGCVAEYFSGIVQPGYHDALHTDYHKKLLSTRTKLNYVEYEEFFKFLYAADGSEQIIPCYNTGYFRLSKMQEHKRIYETCADAGLPRSAKGAGLAMASSGQASAMNSAKGAELAMTGSSLHESSSSRASALCERGEPGDMKTDLSHPVQNAELAMTGLVQGCDETKLIKVFAPGKLILSGEHAVVYGQPALAMAVNRYVTATVTRETVPQVLFDLSDLSHHSRLSYDALHALKEKIKQKYYRFIRGDFSIRDVLQKPFELAQFAMSVLAESLNLAIPQGVKIRVESDLPMGCGMGSSAATIVSVMQAISNYMQLNIPQDQLYRLALEVENMQHGHSSGLDLRMAMQGGCLYMQGDTIEARSVPNLPMYIVNSGTPLSTTGQCVEQAATFFKSNTLQDEFAAVTRAMDLALQQQSWQNIREAIQANHALLVRIGVVPAKVQNFISDITAAGGAAKICGAGTVAGEGAGAVLVLAQDETRVASITSIAANYAYNVIPISAETRGVHAA
jgi:3-hydroxy-3-methylglutaryl CoA synthase/mevalonate kinase